jgi:hypothetical protein
VVRPPRPVGGPDLKALFRRWEDAGWHACFYCDGPLTELQLDHVVPLAAGGADICSNLVPACATCNLTKGDGLAASFIFGGLTPDWAGRQVDTERDRPVTLVAVTCGNAEGHAQITAFQITVR